MSLIRLSASVLTLLLAFQASAANEPTVTDINFTKTYVPNGFDSNDNVEIVGAGIFSNSCYRYSDTKVEVNQNDKTITLTPSAYIYSGFCLQVLMPFDHTVKLGLLPAGTYKIQEATKESLGEITVRTSVKTEADDFMYAPISQAFFKTQGASNLVQISGEFPVSCMKLKDVIFEKQSDVIVVQPIVEMDKSIPCVEGKHAFEKLSDIGALKSGNYLLHVRSMNGKSVNSIVRVP